MIDPTKITPERAIKAFDLLYHSANRMPRMSDGILDTDAALRELRAIRAAEWDWNAQRDTLLAEVVDQPLNDALSKLRALACGRVPELLAIAYLERALAKKDMS